MRIDAQIRGLMLRRWDEQLENLTGNSLFRQSVASLNWIETFNYLMYLCGFGISVDWLFHIYWLIIVESRRAFRVPSLNASVLITRQPCNLVKQIKPILKLKLNRHKKNTIDI